VETCSSERYRAEAVERRREKKLWRRNCGEKVVEVEVGTWWGGWRQGSKRREPGPVHRRARRENGQLAKAPRLPGWRQDGVPVRTHTCRSSGLYEQLCGSKIA
jgi:hypothetical protein